MKNLVQSNSIASDLSPGLEVDMVDRAAVYLTQAVEYPPLTPEAERALVRKIDWIVLPMVSRPKFPVRHNDEKPLKNY